MGGGYRTESASPVKVGPMTNDLSVGLLVVLGVLAGIGALLVLMSRLAPTSAPRPAPTHRAAKVPPRP